GRAARARRGDPSRVPSPPASVKVPNVVGLTEAAASKALSGVGLKIKAGGDPKQGPAKGQSPVAGAQAKAGDTVTVTFPPAPVKVPSVVGLSETAASQALTGVGL